MTQLVIKEALFGWHLWYSIEGWRVLFRLLYTVPSPIFLSPYNCLLSIAISSSSPCKRSREAMQWKDGA